MKEVYLTFRRLQEAEGTRDAFPAASLPFTDKHKIGVSPEGFPMFFIQNESWEKTADVNLEFIKVLFNRTCRLIEDGQEETEKIYTVVSLNSENIDYQRYFIDVVCLLLSRMPEIVPPRVLKENLQKIVDLFSSMSKLPKKTIQGLWAELFVIEQSQNPAYLLQSWHSAPNDKFDFNDGQDKIEVKSSASMRRVHSFSLEQLNPNIHSGLLIASVFVVEVGRGRTVFDLMDSICEKVSDADLLLRLNDIVMQTLGQDFGRAGEISYDYQQAKDTLNFYDFRDVPSINSEYVPQEITNVHFECDLTGVPSIADKETDFPQSLLFKAIYLEYE